jgi:hypothetical protein
MCYNAIISQRVVTDAAAEPVSLDEAKDWMSVDYEEKNDIITSLITAARRLLERKYGIGIIEKDMKVVLNNSCGGHDLPEPPVSEVTAVNADDDAVELTLSGDFDIYVDCPKCDNLTVTYKSGYPLDEVPEDYKTAIKQQVLWMFENLGDQAMQSQVCPMAAMTLAPYKRNTMGLYL